MKHPQKKGKGVEYCTCPKNTYHFGIVRNTDGSINKHVVCGKTILEDNHFD